MYVIEFEPPVDNVVGNFNTFRIGLKWSKTLKPYEHVLLMDTKKKFVFGKAVVMEIMTGKLNEMAKLYAHQNHNQKHVLPPESPADRLIANMQKRYGPHIATLEKQTTVLFLHRFQ
jgi:hypothetical protein